MAVPNFDRAYYLAANPDVAADAYFGQRPEEHWEIFGRWEGRNPQANFDMAQYLANNGDVAAASQAHAIDAYTHYLAFGINEGRTAWVANGTFDNQSYLAQYPDVAAVASQGLTTGYRHYAEFGATESRLANPGDRILRLGAESADVISGNQAHDLIISFGGSDTLYGGDDGDTLYGGLGDDALYGGSGDDTLYGGGNNDTLYGGSGNDVLFANNSGTSNTMFGEGGADRFDFTNGFGSPFATHTLPATTIKDFRNSEGDVIVLPRSISFSQIMSGATDTANGVAFSVQTESPFGGLSITLTGIAKSELQEGWFVFT